MSKYNIKITVTYDDGSTYTFSGKTSEKLEALRETTIGLRLTDGTVHGIVNGTITNVQDEIEYLLEQTAA